MAKPDGKHYILVIDPPDDDTIAVEIQIMGGSGDAYLKILGTMRHKSIAVRDIAEDITNATLGVNSFHAETGETEVIQFNTDKFQKFTRIWFEVQLITGDASGDYENMIPLPGYR